MSQPGTVAVALGRGLTDLSLQSWGDDEGLRETSSSTVIILMSLCSTGLGLLDGLEKFGPS